jgi:REP element-mobilizing transposase RayT
MPRKPRIHFPGALYHVILRGNAGHPIFLNDRGRDHFYELIGEGVERFGYRIHGFCLMTNHVHLLVQVGEIPLSRIIHNLTLRYTAWLNRRHARIGHLFHGRYKALLVDAENYLLELVRYIHLNPVRAGMARRADEYRWTGHRALAGQESLPWMTTDWVLSQFASSVSIARNRYEAFVQEAGGDGERKEFRQGTYEGRIIGDDVFAEEAIRSAEEKCRCSVTIDDIVSAVCRHYGVSEAEMAAPGKIRRLSEARATAALLVRELPGLSLTALATRLGREVSALSRAARLRAKAADDPSMASLFSAIAVNDGKMSKCQN